MILLGKKQELIIVKKVEFGMYLAEKEGAEERVLLPKSRESGWKYLSIGIPGTV